LKKPGKYSLVAKLSAAIGTVAIATKRRRKDNFWKSLTLDSAITNRRI
jgi:hypothetical protein